MAATTDQLIFVTGDEPLSIFASAERAAAYLEWPDVEDGLYRGFDGVGRPVRFDVEVSVEPRRFLRGVRDVKSVVCVVGSKPTEADELRRTLVRVLSDDVGSSEAWAASLVELRRSAVERFGLTY